MGSKLRISSKNLHGKPANFLNVGTGKDISIKDLAYKISNIIGYKGEIIWDNSKPDGTPKKQLDISKISNLGWKAKIDLDGELKKLFLVSLNFDYIKI